MHDALLIFAAIVTPALMLATAPRHWWENLFRWTGQALSWLTRRRRRGLEG